MNSIKHNWEKFGKEDPYYWVTTDSKYKNAQFKKNIQKKFFDHAAKYLESVFKIIRKHLDSKFLPERAMDFGCGVGRVAIPLSQHCKHVLGVDLAESMLKEARKNKAQHQLNNLEFSSSSKIKNLLSNDEHFDFIHSIYVFQHIRTKQGLQTFIQLVDILKENGIGMFHFITFQSRKPVKKKIIYWLCVHSPLFNCINNVRKGKPFFTPIYEMNTYPLNKLFEILKERNCSHIYIRYTKEGHYHGVMLFFQKGCGCDDDFIQLGDIP